MKRLTLLIALMLMFAQVSAFAQITAVPQLMNFQGRLAKPDGTPVPDGTYSVRFSLWTAATGGTEKWNQTISSVTVRNGTFTAQLNTSTGAADKFNNNLFLEIKIGNNPPLTPRQLLASVAYAMKADSVKDGSITANSLANGAVTSAKIADNAVTTSKIPNGAITSAKLESSLQGMLGGFTSDNAHMALIGSVPTNPASSIVVAGNYAYVLGYSLNNTLNIYDVSNPTSPTLVKSVATYPGPRALAVSGNYAYVTSAASRMLEVFDVSNPTNPIVTNRISTGYEPVSIAVSGNRAYVVNQTDNTLYIYDVSSPQNGLTRLGSIATHSGPSSVAVSGNHAFVVNRGGGVYFLQSFDVSNPAAPIARRYVETGFDPISVTVSGNYAYVTHHEDHGPLQIFNISNPAAPTYVNANIPTGSLPFSTAISGPYAFVACSTGYLQLLDIGNPIAPRFLESLRIGSTYSVAVSGNYAYTVSPSPSATLKIFALRTQGINTNFTARGGGFFYGSLHVDQGNLNDGTPTSGLTFGSASGEGIASKRTPGDNAGGLDFYTRYLNRMTITNEGYVGIGTTTPHYDLEVNGWLGCINLTETSDVRYKQNIATLENPLDAILNLRGVTYDWKQKEFPDKNFPAGRQIGFIAQEVEKVLPELVSTDKKGYKSVAYQNVVPVLVEAVKTLHHKYKTQEKQMDVLKTENTELKARNAELKQESAELKTRLTAIEQALAELKAQGK
jgi:hypothetical protein